MSGYVKITQGQGEGTEYKERRLGAVFYINLSIANLSKHYRDRPYFHFDLYSGCGYNEKSRCIGSPIAFLNAAIESKKHNFYAHFVDKDESSCEKLFNLVSRSEHWDRCCVHPGDNRDFIEAIPSIITHRHHDPKWSLGSVLIDPNGHDIPWEELAWLGKECPRLDVIINYNTSIVKRLAGFVENKYHGQLIRLENVPDLLNKRHVQIASPLGSKNQFVLLTCRNFPPKGDHKRLGVYRWNDPEGMQIRYKCGLSRKEKTANQASLGL